VVPRGVPTRHTGETLTEKTRSIVEQLRAL